MLSLAALLLACQPTDPLGALEACQDQACRTAALAPAWLDDPQGTRTWLAGLDDPTVQATLIEGLALEHPADAAALCRALPEGAHARTRCERRVVRPHLDGGGKKIQAEPSRAAGAPGQGPAPGPRSTTLPLLELEPPPWREAAASTLQAALEGCDAGDPLLCGRLVSREHAVLGHWEQAGKACLAGDPDAGSAYAECLFQAAEVLAESRGAQGLGPAMKLCSWSSYGPMCVAHVLTLVGPNAPPAQEVDQADVQAALLVVEAIREVSQGQPALQQSWVDRYWSSWTYTAYDQAGAVDGRLAGLLPPQAQPHLPVAMAANLLQDRDPASLDLEALATELEQAQATGQEQTPGARGVSHRSRALVTNHRIQTWASDRKQEYDIPAAWVMGPGRRAVADDPAADLRICVLEAAAQLREPPPASFFLGVVGDPRQHRLVRWTGARIGGYLDPEQAVALQDPDPLVQQALSHPRKNAKARGQGHGKRPPPNPGPSHQAPQPGE